jgi:chromosome segregation ATPase
MDINQAALSGMQRKLSKQRKHINALATVRETQLNVIRELSQRNGEQMVKLNDATGQAGYWKTQCEDVRKRYEWSSGECERLRERIAKLEQQLRDTAVRAGEQLKTVQQDLERSRGLLHDQSVAREQAEAMVRQHRETEAQLHEMHARQVRETDEVIRALQAQIAASPNDELRALREFYTGCGHDLAKLHAGLQEHREIRGGELCVDTEPEGTVAELRDRFVQEYDKREAMEPREPEGMQMDDDPVLLQPIEGNPVGRNEDEAEEFIPEPTALQREAQQHPLIETPEQAQQIGNAWKHLLGDPATEGALMRRTRRLEEQYAEASHVITRHETRIETDHEERLQEYDKRLNDLEDVAHTPSQHTDTFEQNVLRRIEEIESRCGVIERWMQKHQSMLNTDMGKIRGFEADIRAIERRVKAACELITAHMNKHRDDGK